MKFICPSCKSDLPSWWKIAALFQLYRIFECPRCGSLVEIRVEFSIFQKYIRYLMLAFLVIWVLHTENHGSVGVFVENYGILDFIPRMNAYEKIIVTLTLTSTLFFYSVKSGEYHLTVRELTLEQRKDSFTLLSAISVSFMVILTAMGLYIYSIAGVNWYTVSVLITDALIIFGLRNEWRKLKSAENQTLR